jgi:hypothetical protein
MGNSSFSCLRGGVDRDDANQLLIHKLLDAETGKLTSVAGVLDATKGSSGEVQVV